mmetsp:Transcript_67261/g.197444  ORF Transcript_67261/g.197444 Transcript_67261/m.197444 type:complete len:243 (-) Transcript_67261:96-824(-)
MASAEKATSDAAPAEADDLNEAIEALFRERKEEMEMAGPKAVLRALQEDGKWPDLSAPKCKRALLAAKADMAQREAAAIARRGTKHDCPEGHGLARFITSHASFCCDVCRVYVPQGAGMWGCRKCDWDVCEQKCRTKESLGLADLSATLDSLRERIATASATLQPTEETSALAQLESEIHMLEKSLDAAEPSHLVKVSNERITEDGARAQRKSLLKGSEKLLESIEARFAELKKAKEAADAN